MLADTVLVDTVLADTAEKATASQSIALFEVRVLSSSLLQELSVGTVSGWVFQEAKLAKSFGLSPEIAGSPGDFRYRQHGACAISDKANSRDRLSTINRDYPTTEMGEAPILGHRAVLGIGLATSTGLF